MRKLAAATACVALLFGATACSSYNDHRGKGDAPAAPGDDSPAQIINMPDDFSNLAIKCIKGSEPWAYAATTSDDPMIFQDPAKCGGKVIPGPTQVRPPAVQVQDN